MQALKFVTPGYASSRVAEGSLRVGTLRGYASLEGPRRDVGEATITRVLSEFHGTGDDIVNTPLERFFKAHPSSKVTIKNFSVYEQGPDAYCLCFSKIDTPVIEGQTAFLIKDLLGLARILTDAYPWLGKYFRIGEVSYQPRISDLMQNPQPPINPFQKDPCHETENEIRIIWPGISELTPKRIDTPANSKVAALIEQVNRPWWGE